MSKAGRKPPGRSAASRSAAAAPEPAPDARSGAALPTPAAAEGGGAAPGGPPRAEGSPVAGARPTREELIRGCQGLVRALAWQEHQRVGRRVELDDLIQYGQVGLIKAAERFDASLGNAFTTYAFHCIHGAILDGLRELKWFNLRDYHGGRYQRISREVLAEEGERDPDTAAGDAEWLGGVSRRLAVAYLVSSLDAGERDASESVADEEQTPDAGMVMEEVRAALRAQLAALPTAARELLQAVYFEGQTVTAVGERMGMNKFKASRMHTEALEKLAGALRRRGMGPG
ncbi:MAG: sigma-70 family RNA polymerase sigma factor [Planctomycetia bacterium]|nr:MAG: sigma-70 family RNA polymerase sigma factor [Planctomycetia bacterium]